MSSFEAAKDERSYVLVRGSGACGDPLADDPRELGQECVNMRIYDLPRLGGELNIRVEELRVVEGLGVNEKVEPALQPLSGRPLLCSD